jgi:C4-dicarboxylate-binding protein DctP
MIEATALANKVAQKDNDDALDGVKKAGKTTVYTPTKEERLALKKVLVPVHAKMADRVGKDLIQSIYKETGFDPAKL